MTMYLYCNVGMYNITMLPYSEYCIVLMLSVYMYEYYTLRIYVTVVFLYPVGRGISIIKLILQEKATFWIRGYPCWFRNRSLVLCFRLHEPFLDLSTFNSLDILVNLHVILLTQSTTKFIASRYLISFYS